jgi:hypothetical protein
MQACLKHSSSKIYLFFNAVENKNITICSTKMLPVEGSKDRQTQLCLTVLTSFNCLTHNGDDKPKDVTCCFVRKWHMVFHIKITAKLFHIKITAKRKNVRQ